tara:strand:+ start:884 stop:1033 length:150 start_codon:yes stop_codon:yes gene_type:complete
MNFLLIVFDLKIQYVVGGSTDDVVQHFCRIEVAIDGIGNHFGHLCAMAC